MQMCSFGMPILVSLVCLPTVSQVSRAEVLRRTVRDGRLQARPKNLTKHSTLHLPTRSKVRVSHTEFSKVRRVLTYILANMTPTQQLRDVEFVWATNKNVKLRIHELVMRFNV